MSGLGIPVLINPNRSYWLSSIGNDVIHSTIQVQELDASLGRFSTLFADNIYSSTLNVSTLGASVFDVSGMYVSSIKGNTAFFSTVSLASDLSGGLGYVRFSVDASGIQVDGDPIRFDNLVYLTSSINIVQVSTIVDTDIFGSNGYFSTISTGNFSTNFASLNQANISSLYVSSLEGFDISGADPVEWSLYPTLNSSITFQPNYVLSNVNNKLYFAGQEITDLSGGGSSWSLFPAQSTIQANDNPLIGLSSIRFQDNATFYSLTGNNLFYNGQPIAYGTASNVSQWANFAAVNNVNMNTSSLNNVGNINAVNLALSGSNITNGNTFTGSLSVGGTSLISLASINGLGQLSCQDIDVSNPGVGLADVNIYGATALPGDSALYVQGGVQFDGGSVHGFSAGVLPVAGVNSGRIDMLQAGFNLLHPLVGAITTGAAMSITAGGALSIAGGGYVEMNTSTLQMINTSQGNKNTTIQAGFLTVDPDIAPFSSIKLFNTLGGGVEIDGGGQGSLIGFSTLIGNNFSTNNLNLSSINGLPFSSFTNTNTYNNLFTSSLQVSSIVAPGFPGSKFTNIVGNGLIFKNNDITLSNTFISSLQNIYSPGINLQVQASTIELASPGYIRIGPGGAFDSFFSQDMLSSGRLQALSTISQDLAISTIGSIGGGFPIKMKNLLQFVSPSAVDNIDAINLNPLQIPALNIGASTINLNAANTYIPSLSTVRHSTASLSFSTATNFGSNAAYAFPLFIERDTANNISTGGVAIAVQQHNLGLGAVRNQIEIGCRGNGENYIATLWPGQNLEDLYLNATQVNIVDDAGFSTIVNANPYGLQTNGIISTPALQVSSINGLDARPAYTNNIQTSSMNLYNASTTLLYWSTPTTSLNINTSGYDVVAGLNGTFKVGASLQFNNQSGTDEVEMFFLKNDTVIPGAGAIINVLNNDELMAYMEIIEPLNNGDKIQVGCYTASSDVHLSTIQGVMVESPAAILTMYKLD